MSRTRIKFHDRKIILLLVGLVIAAVFSGVSLYWIALWFLFLWLTGSTLWLLVAARKLALNLEVLPTVVSRKNAVLLSVSLTYPSVIPLPACDLVFPPAGFNPDADSCSIYFGSNRVYRSFHVDLVKPSQPWEKRFQVNCFRRGHHQVGPLQVRLIAPLGPFSVEKTFASRGEFTVQPRLLPFANTFSLKRPHPGERRHLPFTTANSLEHDDLRPFVPGDSTKRISWKVSARQGEWFIKRAKNPGELRILACVELSPDFYFSPREQDITLEKALSLIGYLLSQGFSVGVLTWDGKRRHLPPAQGKQQLLLIRKLFTDLHYEFKGTLLDSLLQHPSWHAGKAQMLWILPQMPEGYTPGLGKLNARGHKLDLFITGDDSMHSSFTNPLQQSLFFRLDYSETDGETGEVRIS